MVASNEPERDLIAVDTGDQFQLEALEPNAYREYCLGRLKLLVTLRAGLPLQGSLDAGLQQTLVARALYVTYQDCVAAGAKTRAQRILGLSTRPGADTTG